jgi:hypothetical protein
VEVSETLVAAGRRLSHHWRGTVAGLTADYVEELLDVIHAAEPELARRLALTVLDLRASGSRNALLRQLPGAVLVGLAARLWFSTSLGGAESRDWRTLHERPEVPTVLTKCRNSAVTIGLLLGVVVVGLGLFRAVTTLTGSWPWGPRWLAVAVLLSLVVFIVGIGAVIASEGEGPTWSFVLVFVGLVLLLVWSPFIGVPTLAGRLGVISTALLLGTVATAVVVLTTWTSRRKRALRNPYRALLQRQDAVVDVVLGSPAG